jgi:predicted ATP-grasp superfamily ATP-dependent carboligase
MTILVLDGNENQAVACVRSLVRAGHRVLVGSSSSWSKAGWSRYCSHAFRYCSPEHDVHQFIRDIAEEVKTAGKCLVLPMSERTTLPLSGQRDAIAECGGRLVLPAHDSLVRAFDKLQMIRLAQSLGITVPETWTVGSQEDAHRLSSSLPYPVVLKARMSNEELRSGALTATGKPEYAGTPAQMLSAYDRLRTRCSAIVVQEFVEGKGTGYFALMRDGELRAEFGHMRLRDVRPTGSGSAVRVSVELDPSVRRAGRRILDALRWHGVAMVEFRLRPDSTPVFMEVNGRFWNSLSLAIYSGVDFPALLVNMVEQRDVPFLNDYRAGVRCRWLLGDLRHVLEVLRGAPAGYPGEFPRRLPTVFHFLLPVAGMHHDNFSLSDPLPELGDWLDFLRRLLSPISRKGAGRGLQPDSTLTRSSTLEQQ